jgi:protein tyrosine phosphatase
MYSPLEKNIRNFLEPHSIENVERKVITPQPPPIKKEEEWETIDEGTIIYPMPKKETTLSKHHIDQGYTTDLDDQNVWGDIIKYERDTDVVDMVEDQQEYKTAEFYRKLGEKGEPDFKWLIDNVVAGSAHPFYCLKKDNLDYLRKAGFKAILTVFEEPLQKHHIEGFEYKFIPTVDGRSPELIEACDFIQKMYAKKYPVLVHCFHGLGRTGTVLAAYLLYNTYNHMNGEEAIEFVRDTYDPNAIETQWQTKAIHKLHLSI